MCDFLSVCMSLDGEKIYVGDLRSHSKTAELLGLKPGSYLEIEWVDDSADKLIVRTHKDYPHTERYYRALVLAHGDTREKFFKYCLQHLPPTLEQLDLSNTGLKEIPGDLKAQTLDLSGCTGLKEIPGDLKVQTLYLSGCTGLKEIPGDLKAQTLDLSGLSDVKVPPELAARAHIIR